MGGISFKEFLSLGEGVAPDSKRPEYQKHVMVSAMNIMKSKCSDALWMLKKNSPFWRGENNAEAKEAVEHGFATVDPSKTKRVSENTGNYYTLLIDNLPAYKKYPKRSHSWVCSRSKKTAESFIGGHGQVYAVIPFNGVKIGTTNRFDIWYTEVSLCGNDRRLDTMNGYWENIDKRPEGTLGLEKI